MTLIREQYSLGVVGKGMGFNINLTILLVGMNLTDILLRFTNEKVCSIYFAQMECIC